jgi:hypothetical protein
MARKISSNNFAGKQLGVAEDGACLLPDLVRFDGIDNSRRNQFWIIKAFTSCEQHLQITISSDAVAAFLLAPEKETITDTWIQGRPIWPDGVVAPSEISTLDRFVSFRLIDEEWCIAEFLNQHKKRVLVPLTLSTYQQLRNALRLLSLTS